MIKKISILTPVLLGILILTTGIKVSAYDVFNQCGPETSNTSVCENRNNSTDPVSGSGGIVMTAAKIVSYFVGVVSVIMIIFAGFRYVTSGGDPNATSTAKNIILYSVIGLAVAVFSQAIIIFVINRI